MNTSIQTVPGRRVQLYTDRADITHSYTAILRLAGIVGLLAACAVGIADVALLYAPGGGYGSGSYEYLRAVPQWRLAFGHFLGVLALPLEIAGFWQVSRMLVPASQKTAATFLLISIYSVIMGTVYHAALAPIAAAVQARQLFAEVSSYAQPFSTITGYGVILISLIFTWAVGFRHTSYPRWVALLNPLALVIAVIMLGRVLPVIGDLLLPATFSIANAVFFSISTVLSWTYREC